VHLHRPAQPGGPTDSHLERDRNRGRTRDFIAMRSNL